MKKSIFQVAAVAALLFSATLSFAQPYGGGYHNPRTPHRPVPGTILYGPGDFAVSNHSLSAQVLGLEYSFEAALLSKLTLIGRAGIVPTGVECYSSLLGSTNAHFNVGVGVTLEPRFYTSFERRIRMGRSTYMNSSDFIAIRNQLIWAPDALCFVITPLYGIRRTTGDHWAHEFTIGPRLAYAGGDPNLSPHVQYRLVFMF